MFVFTKRLLVAVTAAGMLFGAVGPLGQIGLSSPAFAKESQSVDHGRDKADKGGKDSAGHKAGIASSSKDSTADKADKTSKDAGTDKGSTDTGADKGDTASADPAGQR